MHGFVYDCVEQQLALEFVADSDFFSRYIRCIAFTAVPLRQLRCRKKAEFPYLVQDFDFHGFAFV